MKLFKRLAVTLAIILPVCSFAQREYIDDPALHVHEPIDYDISPVSGLG